MCGTERIEFVLEFTSNKETVTLPSTLKAGTTVTISEIKIEGVPMSGGVPVDSTYVVEVDFNAATDYTPTAYVSTGSSRDILRGKAVLLSAANNNNYYVYDRSYTLGTLKDDSTRCTLRIRDLTGDVPSVPFTRLTVYGSTQANADSITKQATTSTDMYSSLYSAHGL